MEMMGLQQSIRMTASHPSSQHKYRAVARHYSTKTKQRHENAAMSCALQSQNANYKKAQPTATAIYTGCALMQFKIVPERWFVQSSHAVENIATNAVLAESVNV